MANEVGDKVEVDVEADALVEDEPEEPGEDELLDEDDELGIDALVEDDLGTDDLVEEEVDTEDVVVLVPLPVAEGEEAGADGDDEDEEEDDDDVEASLDVILKERLVVPDEAEEEEEEGEPTDAEDRADGTTRVLPKQPGEFVCQSCFLVKSQTQLADRRKKFCRDCV